MFVVVVGAGVIGLSIAMELARDSVTVAVLDAGTAMGATSSRGLAWVNASNKSPWPYFKLNCDGVQAHAEQSAKSTEPWFHQVGTVVSQSYRIGLASRVEDHVKWGYRFSQDRLDRYLGASGLREPYAKEDALFYPQEGWIDIETFKNASLKSIVGRGGALHEQSAVVSISAEDDGLHVETEHGTVHVADAVVNAAGAGATAVAAMVGKKLRMRNRWGIIAQVRTTGAPMRHVLMHDLLDIRPGLAGSHFLHSDHVDATLPDNPDRCDLTRQLDDLLQRGRRLHAMFDDAELLGFTIGLRPIPSDGLPVIGPVGSVPHYYEAVSHSGLTLAPVLGRILAGMILGRPDERADLSLFSADRFSVS